MNNYNCLKVKFKDVPVGTWFTLIMKNGTHFHYLKTETAPLNYGENQIDKINAVIISGEDRYGSCAGIYKFFNDNDQVYAGKI